MILPHGHIFYPSEYCAIYSDASFIKMSLNNSHKLVKVYFTLNINF